jgi:hypothetical protein
MIALNGRVVSLFLFCAVVLHRIEHCFLKLSSSDLHSDTPTITSVIYRPENAFSKLTCNSINSPPTNVSLALADSVIVTLRDGESVTVAGVMYELMQTLTDRRTSAYTSLLSMTTTLEGNITRYRCIIINALGNDSKPAGEGCEF